MAGRGMCSCPGAQRHNRQAWLACSDEYVLCRDISRIRHVRCVDVSTAFTAPSPPPCRTRGLAAQYLSGQATGLS
jgi:hypothetical protein